MGTKNTFLLLLILGLMVSTTLCQFQFSVNFYPYNSYQSLYSSQQPSYSSQYGNSFSSYLSPYTAKYEQRWPLVSNPSLSTSVIPVDNNLISQVNKKISQIQQNSLLPSSSYTPSYPTTPSQSYSASASDYITISSPEYDIGFSNVLTFLKQKYGQKLNILKILKVSRQYLSNSINYKIQSQVKFPLGIARHIFVVLQASGKYQIVRQEFISLPVYDSTKMVAVSLRGGENGGNTGNVSGVVNVNGVANLGQIDGVLRKKYQDKINGMNIVDVYVGLPYYLVRYEKEGTYWIFLVSFDVFSGNVNIISVNQETEVVETQTNSNTKATSNLRSNDVIQQNIPIIVTNNTGSITSTNSTIIVKPVQNSNVTKPINPVVQIKLIDPVVDPKPIIAVIDQKPALPVIDLKPAVPVIDMKLDIPVVDMKPDIPVVTIKSFDNKEILSPTEPVIPQPIDHTATKSAQTFLSTKSVDEVAVLSPTDPAIQVKQNPNINVLTPADLQPQKPQQPLTIIPTILPIQVQTEQRKMLEIPQIQIKQKQEQNKPRKQQSQFHDGHHFGIKQEYLTLEDLMKMN